MIEIEGEKMVTFTGLSIIIPTVDEMKAIAETLDIISRICRPEDITEILVIHSKDSTQAHLEVLRALAGQYGDYHVRVICQPDRGLGDALFYGCDISRGSHFLMIGADRENDTYALRDMLVLAKQHPDTVITSSRTLTKDGLREYPLSKRFLVRAFGVCTRIFFGSRQTDITYAYQITPKAVFDPSFFAADHKAFVLELALMADIRTIPVIEIPTRIARRKEGVSHSGFGYYACFAETAVNMFIKMKVGRGR